MESNIEPEFECQICMDLLIEPVTTICGHTFCKICLLRYLKTKLNCPMCRKVILQSKDSLAKNVLLENLIKSKHLENYENKLRIAKLSYDDENSEDDKKRNNLPSIILEECYVWPKLRRKISVTNFLYDTTISMSSVNDRLLVIIPKRNYNETNTVSSLVEILSLAKNENAIEMEINGLKRFKVENFRNVTEDAVMYYF
jgi:hypothetical protein